MNRRNSRKYRYLSAIALSFALSFGATAAAETVTVMTSVKQDANWHHAIDLFTQETGIDVKVIAFTSWDELRTKLPVMVAGGVAPDAVYHDSGAQNDLVAKGVMQSIEPFIKRDHFDTSIWPAPLLKAYRYYGELYSLPTGVSLYAMYYNVGELHSAGLDDLPSDWTSTDFTYDDLVTMAKKLTIDRNGDGKPEQFALNNFFNYGAQALSLWGLDWYNDENMTFRGTEPKVIDTITTISKLWREYHVVGGNFLGGSAAITPIQAYYLNTLGPATDNGGVFKWKVGVLPKAVCRCSTAGFHSWGIAKGAKHPEAAWEFIKFITTNPQAALDFSRTENRVPVLRSVAKAFVDNWEVRNPGMDAHVLTDGVNYVAISARIAGLPRDAWNLEYGTMKKVMTGALSPKSAMEQIQPAIQAMLDKAKSTK